jgi:hypothetical protein
MLDTQWNSKLDLFRSAYRCNYTHKRSVLFLDYLQHTQAQAGTKRKAQAHKQTEFAGRRGCQVLHSNGVSDGLHVGDRLLFDNQVARLGLVTHCRNYLQHSHVHVYTAERVERRVYIFCIFVPQRREEFV